MLDFHCEGINMWGLIHREVLPFFWGSCTLFRINCSKFGFLSKNKDILFLIQSRLIKQNT